VNSRPWDAIKSLLYTHSDRREETAMLTASYARNTYRCLPDTIDPREKKE